VQVIVTHANTDFDAFAAMLAARRLYPGAVIALSGSLNRNVRDFYRLHAEELGIAEPGRVDPGAVERLVVVETSHPARLGEFEAPARNPDVEVVVFDHHAGEKLDWVKPENVVRSEDGALTTTMVAVLAEREVEVSPIEATAFALGIHEDTGSLGYSGTTIRDAEALAWCMRHGASQEMVAQFLHTPLAERERALLDALVAGLEPHEAGGHEVLVTALGWSEYVEGISNLAHKIVDLTDCRALVCLVQMDERVFCVVRTRVAELDASAIAAALGGGDTRRRPPRRFEAPSRTLGRRFSKRSPLPSGKASPRARSCRARPASSLPTTRSRTRWSSASGTGRAECSSATRAPSPESSPGRISTRRSAMGSRMRR